MRVLKIIPAILVVVSLGACSAGFTSEIHIDPPHHHHVHGEYDVRDRAALDVLFEAVVY